ncbi:PQQ-binding-like beta-propeller repeat protein, partial [bacterium]|nr:PQQ-binding-like beta-propeller repeat protein [bacterium]
GFVVFGDKRSKGSGWGHVAAPSPTVSGDNLYVPVMNGTVYVLNWKQETFNKKSIVAINDLGLAGKAYTRSSLSFANGNAFAHTLRELICIGKSPIKP